MNTIVSGTPEDLARIREIRRRIGASSDRETVRRMCIFCSVMLERIEAGNQILLHNPSNKSQLPAVIWTL